MLIRKSINWPCAEGDDAAQVSFEKDCGEAQHAAGHCSADKCSAGKGIVVVVRDQALADALASTPPFIPNPAYVALKETIFALAEAQLSGA